MKQDPISTVRFNRFSAGMNNRAPDFQLEQTKDEEGKFTQRRYLRTLVNADVTDQGSVRRREGFRRVLSGGSGYHSLWGDGISMYFVQGRKLKKATGDPDALVVTTVAEGLMAGAPVSFTSSPYGIFFTDGHSTRRLSTRQLATLNPVPRAVASSGGALPPGEYGVAFAYADATGAESPTTSVLRITVPANGKIDVSDLPSVWPAGVTSVIIFMTRVDSTELYQSEILYAPEETRTITTEAREGNRPLAVAMAIPAGHLIRYHYNRLYIANEHILYYSEPFAPGTFDPMRGYIPFSAPIDVMESVSGGMFVVADKTWWKTEEAMSVVSENQAVRGTGGTQRDGTCYWMSDDGLVIGRPDGTLDFLQKQSNAVASAERGTAFVRETDGKRQLVASVFGAGATSLAAKSFIDAELVKRG